MFTYPQYTHYTASYKQTREDENSHDQEWNDYVKIEFKNKTLPLITGNSVGIKKQTADIFQKLSSMLVLF